MYYYIYHPGTGRITASGFAPENDVIAMAGDFPWREGLADPSAQYCDLAGNLLDRAAPAFQPTVTASGSDWVIEVAGLPAGTIVGFGGPVELAAQTVNDGTFEALVNVAGSYEVVIDAVAFTVQTLSLEVA